MGINRLNYTAAEYEINSDDQNHSA